MRTFIKRALGKLNKLSTEQITDLLRSVVDENEILESVIQSLDDGLLVFDRDGLLIQYNKAAERYLPLKIGDGYDRPIEAILDDEQLSFFLQKTLRSGDKVERREFDIENKGILRLLSISVLPLVSGRQVAGSVIRVEDITDRRNKEARLRRAENLASLTTLAAGVAHEIKNPLGSISIHIQLIQRSLVASCTGSEKIDKYLSVVHEEIDRLNHIVLDFLFAVRPMDIQIREADINLLISELISFMKPEMEQAGIGINLNYETESFFLPFDERYMKQALLNLIKNAQAAILGPGTITIKTSALPSEFLIEVCDSGTGIGEDDLPKIFEPYFTTRDSGSGLGLTMVYKIVKEHNGEISVRSTVGEGSCFTISLPLPQKETKLISWKAGAE